MAKAANLLGQFGKGQGVGGVGGAELVYIGRERGLVASDQRALSAALFGAAKGVERGAAQHFQRRQQFEAPGHQRRGQVVVHLVFALEHSANLFAKGRVAVQAGDFVFVFVGHQFEQVARDGKAQWESLGVGGLRCVAGTRSLEALFDLAHALHKGGVTAFW